MCSFLLNTKMNVKLIVNTRHQIRNMIRNFCQISHVNCYKSNNALIKISGSEVKPFLQGIVANDINNLRKDEALYSYILNNNGRVAYDVFIYEYNQDNLYIECDRNLENDVKKYLTFFRLRKKISIESIEGSSLIYFSDAELNYKYLSYVEKCEECEIFGILKDSRLKLIARRLFIGEATDFNSNFIVVSDREFKKFRYKLGIAEGGIEIPFGKCVPQEYNSDFLNSVSFNKGCYIGQELTARIYHRGVIRKRIIPFKLEKIVTVPLESEIVNSSGKAFGKIRGIEEEYGIGLIRLEAFNEDTLMLKNGIHLSLLRPTWWPNKL